MKLFRFGVVLFCINVEKIVRLEKCSTCKFSSLTISMHLILLLIYFSSYSTPESMLRPNQLQTHGQYHHLAPYIDRIVACVMMLLEVLKLATILPYTRPIIYVVYILWPRIAFT